MPPRPSTSPRPIELAGMDKCPQQVTALELPSAPGPHRVGSAEAGQGPGGGSAGRGLEERSFLLKTAASASLSLE